MNKRLIFIFFIINSFCFSQKKNISNTSAYIKKNKLDKAQLEIDAAVLYETTKNLAKTWMYYGDVYFRILTSNENHFKNLDQNPGIKSLKGYLNTLNLNTKKINTVRIEKNIKLLQKMLLNSGIQYFNEKKYMVSA